MRIRCILMFCLLLAASGGLYAQGTEAEAGKATRANVVKVNTLPLLFGSLNVSYERRITPHIAGAITATAYPRRLTLSRGDTSSTYAITADTKIYLKGESPEGFYIAPYLKYRLLTRNPREGNSDGFFIFYSPDREAETWTSYGAGTALGFQQVFSNGFALDVFWGIGYYFHQGLVNKTTYTKQEIQDRKPWQYDVRLGLLLCYAF